MSAARAEWNRLANNIPALEERSSDKDEHLAPSDGASVAPLASTFSRTGTEVGKESERSYVKTTPQRSVVREATSTTDTMTRRAKPNEEWTTHPKMVTRTVIGPPLDQIRSLQWQSLLSSPSLQFGHKLRNLARGITEAHLKYRNVAIPEFSLLEIILTLPLFGAHSMYWTRLRTRVKWAVHLPDFRTLMQQLLDEWADSNLLATIFVNANIVFLAVPGIDALQKTASLASSLFAMMSIAVEVHHVWRHCGKVDTLHQDAASIISNSTLLMDY
ncbi:hypothetical protein F4604DRAFT_1931390 [Suillus subluteus]|nr:hypothetical protein F4604DRAFT_1931390 [Suillus subluteus]